MQILDGKIASQQVKDRLKQEVGTLSGRKPHLAVVLVGDNGASQSYVTSKIKSCKEVGYDSTLVPLSSTVSQSELVDVIQSLNTNTDIDGILVQLPLPSHIDQYRILTAIAPEKDVDGFHPMNVGKLVLNQEDGFIPATPLGILMLLEHYQVETESRNVVVIGRSNIVGRPLSILLSQQRGRGNATVTLCHNKTTGLTEITRQADILISAVGIPDFITPEMVKEGAVVVDVGITRIEDPNRSKGYRLVGDVDFQAVAPRCSYITPVPGGVGLMTVVALLQNTFKAYLYRKRTTL